MRPRREESHDPLAFLHQAVQPPDILDRSWRKDPYFAMENKLAIDSNTPPLTDADMEALDATTPPSSEPKPTLRETLEACASRTKAYIADQPVRATLMSAAGGAALALCLTHAFGASRREE